MFSLPGTRSWIQRLVIRGRRRELGLGAAALAKAREQALANSHRQLARSGGDPLAEKARLRSQGAYRSTSAATAEELPAAPDSGDAARSRDQ